MKRPFGISTFRIAAAVVLSLLAAPVIASDEGTWTLVEEHWYVVEMAGGRAGSMHVRVDSDASRFRSGSAIRMSMDRGPVPITIEITTSFIETRDGKPLIMTSVQDMGMQSIEHEWRFEDDHVVYATRQGGRENARQRPWPDVVGLTPMAVHRLWLAGLEAGDKEISYTMLDAQTGLEPITVTHTFVGAGEYQLGNRTIPVTVWKTATSMMPLTGLEKYSTEGYLVHQAVDFGMGNMVTRLATKAEALAEIVDAPELLVSTFVEPDRRIARAADASTATLRLRVTEGTLPLLPAAGAQRVYHRLDNRAATLMIDINDNLPATEAEIADAAYRESSAMIESDDPLIRKLAASSVRDAGDDPMDRADAIRASVHKLVSNKGLDTAFATASETARTRAGDCSEHAVLLAALLRAQEIPARVAVGLVYADSFLEHRDIFGWHMWTQALIDGRWVDFDATLDRRYHAAHVLTATTSLGDGGIDAELASMLMLMGRIEIDVVDVGYDP